MKKIIFFLSLLIILTGCEAIIKLETARISILGFITIIVIIIVLIAYVIDYFKKEK